MSPSEEQQILPKRALPLTTFFYSHPVRMRAGGGNGTPTVNGSGMMRHIGTAGAERRDTMLPLNS